MQAARNQGDAPPRLLHARLNLRGYTAIRSSVLNGCSLAIRDVSQCSCFTIKTGNQRKRENHHRREPPVASPSTLFTSAFDPSKRSKSCGLQAWLSSRCMRTASISPRETVGKHLKQIESTVGGRAAHRDSTTLPRRKKTRRTDRLRLGTPGLTPQLCSQGALQNIPL
jgi:hypothetical protein